MSLFKPRPRGGGTAGADQVAVGIENFDGRARGEVIAAGSKDQGSGNFLPADESTGRIIAIEYEFEGVIRPAVVLPGSVAGAAQSRGLHLKGTDAIFRHCAAFVKGEQTVKRGSERVASDTVNWCNHRSPDASPDPWVRRLVLVSRLSGSEGKRRGQSRNRQQRTPGC